jgi:hypothetical protein
MTKFKKGWLNVHKVNTKENWADIFTNPLPKTQFCILRDKLMGWLLPQKQTIHPNFPPTAAVATLAFSPRPQK